ncbi:MAG TPA: hypothetical protein VMR98_04165, partial [Candidatus Polarisedimenticolaceae bacterium]|nr:hypothetical protein [Candidatus Polarisedimenticolaceae bacterium]
VRPVAGAAVSTPLKWSEVRKGLDPQKFTMKSMPARLKKVGDIWQPVIGKGVDLNAVLKDLAAQRETES